mmetsp:Transcript_23918/g.61611  ORF Transcript_23918/g.61611 Transcript_23918/m.61611 type:complete len:394 (+) Transcript_23918:78-1259(+)
MPASYDPKDNSMVCTGYDKADLAALAKEYKGFLFLAKEKPDVPKADGVETMFVPLASDFQDNPIALAGPVFEALDKLPRPTLVACKSGRRARVVIAAYVAVRHGGDADTAVEFLRANHGDVADDAPQREQWVRGAIAAFTTAPKAPLIFRQLFEKESSTYTYLLADSVTKEAILIDPVDLTADRDLAEVAKYVAPDGTQGLKLVAALNTHCHADHITGTAILKQKAKVQSVIAKAAGAKADRYVVGGDKVRFGSRWVEVIATPGHTNGCVSFVLDDRSMVFTGDALLIKACGRTDFQQGSPETLWKSVRGGIFTLPPECVVYPAHDYQGRSASSVREERLLNPRLGDHKTLEEFVEIMKNLNLPYPKKIDASLPANLLCGFPDEASWKAAAGS